MATSENDIVMDFFLGSGTTAAVSHKMGRKYIGIEQLDYGENDSVVRLKNVINGDKTGIAKYINWNGGGSFIYAELKKWNQTYIDEIESGKVKILPVRLDDCVIPTIIKDKFYADFRKGFTHGMILLSSVLSPILDRFNRKYYLFDNFRY